MTKDKFIIKGGNALKGEVEIKGAKNAAFPVLAATLLTKDPCIIDNIPLIEDIFKMLKILEGLGAKISWLEKRKIKVDCSSINPSKIPFNIVGFFRGSILLLGPLLARFNKIKIPPPGGCVIGARPVDTHLDAFSQLGIKINSDSVKFYKGEPGRTKDSFYYFEKNKNFSQQFHTVSAFREKGKDKPNEVVLREFSVTATENVLLFSALSSKKTILKNS